MDSRWTPNGANEVGIDGHIELFDPSSHEALGLTARDLHLVLGPDCTPGIEVTDRTDIKFEFRHSRCRRLVVHFDIRPDDLGNLFEEAFILRCKSRRIVAVDVDLADDLSTCVNRDDDLRFCFDRAG